jgi:hypothetical protein
MKKSIKPLAKQRPVLVSALAAKVLGHSRVQIDKPLSTKSVTAAFPAYNEMELTTAMTELVDKNLVTQDGHDEEAVFALTERGRLSRVSVG